MEYLEQRVHKSELDPLIDFFLVFARFEYAMKLSDFTNEYKGHPEADWNKLADELPNSFFKEMEEAKEAAILFNCPPLKQCWKNKEEKTGLDWEPVDKRNGDNYPFRLITTVRNNLIHGQKFTPDPRNKELVQAALFVLNAVYDQLSSTGKHDCLVNRF